MLIKSTKQIFDFNLSYSFSISRIKKGFAIGTYSICDDGKHIIYLDYDNFRFEWLLTELRHLRDKYQLSDFLIFRSSKDEVGMYKHHAVCFDKVTARVYNSIVMDSNADMLFKNNGFFDFENARVLRFSAKSKSSISAPYYFCTLKSKHHLKNKSKSHIDFYQNMFKIKTMNRKNQDDSDNVRLISYATKNI